MSLTRKVFQNLKTEQRYGFSINDPSQRQQMCLMSGNEELWNLYATEALKR